MNTKTLANGIQMPTIGLGVYQTKKGEETQRTLYDI
jgi:diketogulonate reductase-like aldo/keto reductase